MNPLLSGMLRTIEVITSQYDLIWEEMENLVHQILKGLISMKPKKKSVEITINEPKILRISDKEE